MFFKNVEYHSPRPLSLWRKAAIGTWGAPGDPSVYASVEIPVENILNFIQKKSAHSGEKITITHFFGSACALVFKKHPDLNVCLRLGRLYPRKEISVFFQVASDQKGEDLSGALIRNCDQKTLIEIARELKAKVKTVREGTEKIYSKSKNKMEYLPGMWVRLFIYFMEKVTYAWNLWSPFFGVPKDGFGSVMITNIGSLGLDMAFAPLVPFSRVPVLIVLGAVKDRPCVVGGEVKVHKSIQLCVTFDHRVIDGVHGAQMSKTLLEICHHPDKYLPV